MGAPGVPSAPACSGCAQREGRGGLRWGQPDGACDWGMPCWEEGIAWRRTRVPKVMGQCRKLIMRVLESQGASSARSSSSDTALSTWMFLLNWGQSRASGEAPARVLWKLSVSLQWNISVYAGQGAYLCSDREKQDGHWTFSTPWEEKWCRKISHGKKKYLLASG